MFDTREIRRASLEEAVRQMPAAVIVVEAPSGMILFRNQRAQEIRERSSSRARGTGLEGAAGFEILHPDGRPYEVEEWPLMRSIRDGEKVRDEEFIYPLADGSRLWLRCNSSPIYDDEGRLVAGVLVGDDVTERKRTEEELHRSEERFRSLVQNTSDIITVVDAEGTISYISSAVERVLGYRPEEMIGKDILDEGHPDDVAWVKNKLTALLKEAKGPSSMWYRVRDKEGAWHHFEAVATNLLDDPSVKGIVIDQRDASERKKAEERLRESNRRVENILESITDAFWAVDREWRFTYVNERALDYLGNIRGEAITRARSAGARRRAGTRAATRYRRPVAPSARSSMAKSSRKLARSLLRP